MAMDIFWYFVLIIFACFGFIEIAVHVLESLCRCEPKKPYVFLVFPDEITPPDALMRDVSFIMRNRREVIVAVLLDVETDQFAFYEQFGKKIPNLRLIKDINEIWNL